MSPYEFFIEPFMQYGFMRSAFAACLAIAVSGAPLGMFLVLRRMALMGEAISHAVLPGVAVAYWLFGLSLIPMAIGGLTAGLAVAWLASLISNNTQQSEDASFTGLFTLSLATGVLMISLGGSPSDLLHILFGHVLTVDPDTLTFMLSTSSFSLLMLAVFYRSFVVSSFDAPFLQMAGRNNFVGPLFLLLLVLNLVSAFQALGTLLAVGLMILPAISARFWTRSIDTAIALAAALAVAASLSGLLLSFHFNLPAAPAIVLSAGALYAISVLCGRENSIYQRLFPRKHYAH